MRLVYFQEIRQRDHGLELWFLTVVLIAVLWVSWQTEVLLMTSETKPDFGCALPVKGGEREMRESESACNKAYDV